MMEDREIIAGDIVVTKNKDGFRAAGWGSWAFPNRVDKIVEVVTTPNGGTFEGRCVDGDRVITYATNMVLEMYNKQEFKCEQKEFEEFFS